MKPDLPSSYSRLQKFGSKKVDDSMTHHNFKREVTLMPEWNNYLGKDTYARTEDQYQKELKERRLRRQLQVESTLRSGKSRGMSRDVSQRSTPRLASHSPATAQLKPQFNEEAAYN
jgi:hypothetical protein